MVSVHRPVPARMTVGSGTYQVQLQVVGDRHPICASDHNPARRDDMRVVDAQCQRHARVPSVRNRHDGTFGLNGNHAILTIAIVVYACDLRERTSSEYSEDYRRGARFG